MAFSAESDSTLLAPIISKESKDSLLVTVDNNMMPDEFIDYARRKADEFDLKHGVIALDFLEKGIFQNNVKERCYECRKIMYHSIQQFA